MSAHVRLGTVPTSDVMHAYRISIPDAEIDDPRERLTAAGTAQLGNLFSAELVVINAVVRSGWIGLAIQT